MSSRETKATDSKSSPKRFREQPTTRIILTVLAGAAFLLATYQDTPFDAQALAHILGVSPDAIEATYTITQVAFLILIGFLFLVLGTSIINHLSKKRYQKTQKRVSQMMKRIAKIFRGWHDSALRAIGSLAVANAVSQLAPKTGDQIALITIGFFLLTYALYPYELKRKRLQFTK